MPSRAVSLGRTPSRRSAHASASENKIGGWEEGKLARAVEAAQEKLFGEEKSWERAASQRPRSGRLRPSTPSPLLALTHSCGLCCVHSTRRLQDTCTVSVAP